MRIWFLAGMALLFSVAVAAEGRMKPIATGGGEPVDGLRTSLVMVKNDFGPGESLMAVWKLTNEGDKAAEIKLGKNHVYEFTFEARRDGKDIAINRLDFKDFHSPSNTLEPGESLVRSIDLRAIHVHEAKWCEPLGKYEVRVTCLSKNIKTGWAKFSITGAGEQAPEINPELAEKIGSLIRQMGHEEFAQREGAYKELRAIGKPALHQLNQTADDANGDPEVRARCKKLIDEIQAALAPVVVNPPPHPRPVPLPQPVDPPPDFGDF
jgi:hypothetical protein